MMQDPINHQNSLFWEDLQSELFISQHKINQNDFWYFIEKSFVYSLFFKGCSRKEISSFQSILNAKDYGYMLFITLSQLNGSRTSSVEIDESTIYHCIKKILSNKAISIVGPLLGNRFSVTIFTDNNTVDTVKEEGISFAKDIASGIKNDFNYLCSIGIGSLQSIYSLHTSYIESLRSLRYCDPDNIVHINDLDAMHPSQSCDYIEIEKCMINSIRLRKIDAYDYFSILMDSLASYKDEDKRNKILELLILSSRAMRMDGLVQSEYANYMILLKKLSELKGSQLIEWAYQQFIYMARVAKPNNLIDYSNKIVLATKEYLEAHYAEDVTLEALAEQVNISPQYFSKLIKKNTGFNFVDWLSMLRVRKAKELLNNPHVTVKEVCFLVGYKDPNYFSRIFKKRIGITPSEYVKTSAYLNNTN